ncbi:hypothetical protein [Streptomyces canus]|uniref:hypothetical protein n=1 Tax=Streptomyces canus TaxID=58343 RepID=UPI00372045B5
MRSTQPTKSHQKRPSSAWKTDTTQYNVLKLDIVSGSGGSAYLSAGTSFDCMDLLA